MKRVAVFCALIVSFVASTTAFAQSALVVDAQDRVLGIYLYGFADSSPSRRPAIAILHSSGYVFRVRTMDALVAGAPILDRGTFRYEEDGTVIIYFGSLDCKGQAYVPNPTVSSHYKAGVVFSGDSTGYRLVATEFNAAPLQQTIKSYQSASECINLSEPSTSTVLAAQVGGADLAGILPSYTAPLRLVYNSECVFKNGFECASKDAR